MKRQVILIGALLTMVIFGIQMAGPVAAAHPKVVDKFTQIAPLDSQSGGDKFVTIVYQYNSNYLKIKEEDFTHNMATKTFSKVPVVYWTTLKKVSTAKLKIMTPKWFEEENNVNYVKTKFTAAKYYWRVYRSHLHF